MAWYIEEVFETPSSRGRSYYLSLSEWEVRWLRLNLSRLKEEFGKFYVDSSYRGGEAIAIAEWLSRNGGRVFDTYKSSRVGICQCEPWVERNIADKEYSQFKSSFDGDLEYQRFLSGVLRAIFFFTWFWVGEEIPPVEE